MDAVKEASTEDAEGSAQTAELPIEPLPSTSEPVASSPSTSTSGAPPLPNLFEDEDDGTTYPPPRAMRIKTEDEYVLEKP